MTIAHDFATESPTWTISPNPFTFNHSPASTPAGVLVFIYHGTSSSVLITGVTYGGVTMTRIRTVNDLADEPGRSYIYFLGFGIPSGTQEISIDYVDGTQVKIATCVTLTAETAAVSEISGSTTGGDVANPQHTLAGSGNSTIRYCVIYSGLADPSSLTILSGMSAVSDHNFGTFVGRVDRQTTASPGSFTIGYTSAIDDVAFCSCGITESVPRGIHNGSWVRRFTSLLILAAAQVVLGCALPEPLPLLLSHLATSVCATVEQPLTCLRWTASCCGSWPHHNAECVPDQSPAEPGSSAS